MSELLKINVNDHTERKNGLSYLSWAWAWAEVLKIDPGALWVAHTYGPPGSEEPCMRVGKSAMVHVSVTIKGLRRECMLPVMDHRNKAIPEPDAFQVNTAIMRCLAKAIAMHGLGLYIYAGEDLPEDAAPEPKKLDGIKATPTAGAMDAIPADERAYIKELADDLISYSSDSARVERIEIEQLDADQKVALWSLLPSNIRSGIKAASKAKL